MPRKPQQQRSKATVDAIVEAGFICVAERGVTGMTTRHVADIAGISVGSLYEYFANKEEIFDAMQARFVAEVVAMVQPLLPTVVRMSISDAIHTILGEFQTLLMKNDQRYLKCARNALQFQIKDYGEPIFRLVHELVMQHILHHPEHTKVRNIPAMTYIFINGAMYTILRHLSDPNPPISFEQLTDGLADMVGHYVTQEMRLAGG